MADLNTRRALAFLRRHAWSLPLAGTSTLCFIQLASELREGELASFDAQVGKSIARFRGTVDWMMLGLTQLGARPSLTFLAVIAVLALVLRGRRAEGAYVTLATGGAALLNVGLKLLFQRARPDAAAVYLVARPDSFSFPSGHAMCSAGFFASLAVVAHVLGGRSVWSRLATACCLLLALGVGLSRVYLGVHYASDVLGGQLGAAAWVSALTGWFYPRLLPGERRSLGHR